MSVSAVPLGDRLSLRLNVGMTPEMTPIYSTRNYANVRPTAGDDDLFDIAQLIGDLTEHTLDSTRRVKTLVLEE